MKPSALCCKRADTTYWLQSRTEGMPRTHAHPLFHLFISSPPCLLHVFCSFPLCFAFTISHNEMRPPLQHDVTCLRSCFVFRQNPSERAVLVTPCCALNTANSTLHCAVPCIRSTCARDCTYNPLNTWKLYNVSLTWWRKHMIIASRPLKSYWLRLVFKLSVTSQILLVHAYLIFYEHKIYTFIGECEQRHSVRHCTYTRHYSTLWQSFIQL